MTTFSRAIAHTLASYGVRHTFGLMGAGNLRVIDHLLHDHGVAYHAARHESGAIAAADGYARTTEGLGVALVTQGPGFTNALTPLVTARRAGTPLLLLTGDSTGVHQPGNPFPRVQAVPQATLLAAVDIPTVRPRPASAAHDLAMAIDMALTRETPVAFSLPAEYATAPSPLSASTPSPASRLEADAGMTPSAGQLDAAAATLRAATRPVVLAGLGAVRAGAHDALATVAEQVGAMLATSLRAAGLFFGHPNDVGISGGFARQATHAALAGADCVLAVGASLNEFTTDKGKLFSQAEVIHCDTDPTTFVDFGPPALRITGDARLTAEGLRERVAGDDGRAARLAADPLAQAALGNPRDVFDDVSGDGVVDPRALCAELDAILPPERTVVVDSGHFSHFVMRHTTATAPRQLYYMIEFGAVGGGMGAAMGATVGRPEQTTALYVGDGGFMMSLGDLDLAVREHLPLLVVVLNDCAYGAELEVMRHAGIDPRSATFETPDLAAIAESMGCAGQAVTALDDLAKATDTIRAGLDRPLVLDCRVSREVSSGLIGG